MFAIRQTSTFSSWLRNLRDQRAKQKITGRLQRLKFGHFGDVEPVGHGVSELRIHEGKGYRVYFCQQGDEIIVLLCGGDKKSQQRDIAQAQRIWKELGNEK
ncbi:MAG: type II toxin-antitoxin system RelE/ParE family toxin [Roseovarius sp.]|nr:type II toxin-antitoxin system RelE/ParE family toxin [Roseovarius sp.]